MGSSLSVVDRELKEPDRIEHWIRNKTCFSPESVKNIDAFLMEWAPQHPQCPPLASTEALASSDNDTRKRSAARNKGRKSRPTTRSSSPLTALVERDSSLAPSGIDDVSDTQSLPEQNDKIWDAVARTTSSSCLRNPSTFDISSFWSEGHPPAGTGQARILVESYYEGLRLEKSSEKATLRWRCVVLFFSDLADEVVKRSRDLPRGNVLRLSTAETSIISNVLSREPQIEIKTAEAKIREWRACGRKMDNFCQELGSGAIFYFSNLSPNFFKKTYSMSGGPHENAIRHLKGVLNREGIDMDIANEVADQFRTLSCQEAFSELDKMPHLSRLGLASSLASAQRQSLSQRPDDKNNEIKTTVSGSEEHLKSSKTSASAPAQSQNRPRADQGDEMEWEGQGQP